MVENVKLIYIYLLALWQSFWHINTIGVLGNSCIKIFKNLLENIFQGIICTFPSTTLFQSRGRAVAKVYLGPCEASAMELLGQNSQWLIVINFFSEKSHRKCFNIFIKICLPLFSWFPSIIINVDELCF